MRTASRGNPARFFVTADRAARGLESMHSCNESPVPGV
jgi:hypothetical protein